MIAITLVAPMVSTPVQAADPSDWYSTAEGVLDSDYYTLYPYETDKSLKIGFSKYGEMINGNENVGLEYGDVDPFAPPAGSGIGSIPKVMWVQGWLCNITYEHMTLGHRNVWTMALFSDTHQYSGPWIRVDYADDYKPGGFLVSEDPGDTGYYIGDYAAGSVNYGGRKTNGTVVTDPIQVLYDGPRKFIAQVGTTIYDHTAYAQDTSPEDETPLLKVSITFVFNKVKKEVILLKDIKSLVSEKVTDKLKVQFSNRGELDLGTDASGYHSYFHFNTSGIASDGSDTEASFIPTCYNASWEIFQTEPAEEANICSVDFAQYSGYSAHGGEPGAVGTYDVAQAINPDAGYVWFGAFWPSLSDWSIDGWPMWWRSMDAADPHDIDARSGTSEPKIPFYIGEWDFWLNATTYLPDLQFRGVTVYGITDYHDADDLDMGYGHHNVLDREVKYQLDEVFNPWDLEKAVHKDTARWVEFTKGWSWTSDHAPVLNVSREDWDQYCVFSERVVDLTTGKLLNRWEGDYKFSVNASGYATITGLDYGHYKILYSTNSSMEVDGYNGRYEWIVVGRDAASVDSVGAALVSESFDSLKNVTTGIGGEDKFDSELANQIPYVMHKFGTGDTMEDYKNSLGRSALKDDWCTYWPVASSNMIGVGGPLANMLAYYGNDFTDALYGLPEYAADSPYSGKITGVPCWNRGWDGTWNVYESSESTGYAVISTYKDINGTVLFLVWGNWGRDTYFASQWLHGDEARGIMPGIVQLQDAPSCLTSIVLKIDYADPKHPTFSIVECLGTISETKWTHTYIDWYTGEEETEVKGKIHDP